MTDMEIALKRLRQVMRTNTSDVVTIINAAGKIEKLEAEAEKLREAAEIGLKIATSQHLSIEEQADGITKIRAALDSDQPEQEVQGEYQCDVHHCTNWQLRESMGEIDTTTAEGRHQTLLVCDECFERMTPKPHKAEQEVQDEGCKGYWTETSDGREFDCEYEHAGEITCDHCKYGPDPDGYDPSRPMDEQEVQGEDECRTCRHRDTGSMVFCNNCHAGDNYEPQEAQEECVWTKIYDVAMNCDMWRSGCNTHAKWDMPEDGICPQCKGGIVAEQGEG